MAVFLWIMNTKEIINFTYGLLLATQAPICIKGTSALKLLNLIPSKILKNMD